MRADLKVGKIIALQNHMTYIFIYYMCGYQFAKRLHLLLNFHSLRLSWQKQSPYLEIIMLANRIFFSRLLV